jgi:Glucuronate isomerase
VILFTLDETIDARELAPLAGHYPCLKLGPPWWFYDSPEGMRRFRERVTETAGFYNTVGFNDDTRAYPRAARPARRMDCGYLAQLAAEHRLDEDEAFALAPGIGLRAREARLQALARKSVAGCSGSPELQGSARFRRDRPSVRPPGTSTGSPRSDHGIEPKGEMAS